jgi:hypothetical protein
MEVLKMARSRGLWMMSGARLFEGGLARLIGVHQRKKETPKGLL